MKFRFFDVIYVQLSPVAHVKRNKSSAVTAISNSSQTLTNRRFDFIPLTDIVAFDFTETDPINSNFDWLGYSSINTIELLGSLLLFFFVLVG